MSKTPDQIGDEELLRRMLAGDGGAFAQLYQRWQASVYRFALRLGESEALAEDVTQDVFLTLMREGRQYAGRGTFAAYIFSITRHRVLRRLQRERRFVALELEADSEEGEPPALDERLIARPDPLAELAHYERLAAVRQAVLSLPLPYREVVLLCHLHELTYAEAAEIIGCEIGTVCSRLYRARALLAERLVALKTDEAPQVNWQLARCLV